MSDQQFTPPPGFKNRVLVSYTKWETVGTAIEGHYIGSEMVRKADGDTFRLLRLRTGKGATVKATMPPVLADLMESVAEGELVHIIYVGEETRDGGQLKMFQVYRA